MAQIWGHTCGRPAGLRSIDGDGGAWRSCAWKEMAARGLVGVREARAREGDGGAWAAGHGQRREAAGHARWIRRPSGAHSRSRGQGRGRARGRRRRRAAGEAAAEKLGSLTASGRFRRSGVPAVLWDLAKKRSIWGSRRAGGYKGGTFCPGSRRGPG